MLYPENFKIFTKINFKKIIKNQKYFQNKNHNLLHLFILTIY